MKELKDIILPSDRFYTKEHIWIKENGDSYYVGISDFAQDQLGEVVYVDLPYVGDNFATNDSFGEVESVKSVNKLFMPFAGTVIGINEELENTPSLINASCYEKAWIMQIIPENSKEITNLLSADRYLKFLEK